MKTKFIQDRDTKALEKWPVQLASDSPFDRNQYFRKDFVEAANWGANWIVAHERERGASLPNELLLMALEALEKVERLGHNATTTPLATIAMASANAYDSLQAIRAKLESEIK